MRIREIRALTDEQLKKEFDASHRELMNLRFRLATMQLSNVHEVRKARKNIARILTVMRERELVKV